MTTREVRGGEADESRLRRPGVDWHHSGGRFPTWNRVAGTASIGLIIQPEDHVTGLLGGAGGFLPGPGPAQERPAMKVARFAVGCSLVLTSCAGLSQPQGSKQVCFDELEFPGYVDVGIGYAVAFDSRSGSHGDADGTFVSLKAYPAGRWYSKRKSETAQALAKASANMVADIVEPQETPAGDGPPAGGAGVDGAPATDENKVDLAETVEQLIKARAEIIEDDAYYVVEGRDTWKHRLSIFYGTSVGDLAGGGLESSANAVGVGYDVAPQLALQLGWAFYDVETDGVIGTDSGLFFSVSLNLSSFKSLLSAGSGK